MAQASPYNFNVLEQLTYDVAEKNHAREWRIIARDISHKEAMRLVDEKPWSRELR